MHNSAGHITIQPKPIRLVSTYLLIAAVLVYGIIRSNVNVWLVGFSAFAVVLLVSMHLVKVEVRGKAILLYGLFRIQKVSISSIRSVDTGYGWHGLLLNTKNSRRTLIIPKYAFDRSDIKRVKQVLEHEVASGNKKDSRG